MTASADQEIDLGIAKQRDGNLEGAVQCFKRALQHDPSCFAAYNHLGNVFASLQDWQTSLIFVQAAAALNPNSAEICGNLAHLYLKQNNTEAAIDNLRKAAAFKPNDPIYANSLGNALRQAGNYAEAEAWMHKALRLQPNFAEAYVNLGFLYAAQQRSFSQVEDCYNKAIALKPDLAEAHVNLSHCLLRRAAFTEGWAEHEWRWRWKDFPSPKRHFTEPQWKGKPIAGASILIHAEQGFGDTIQFLRYLPMLVGRGARVTLEVHPELHSFVAGSMPDGVHVVSRGDLLPRCDWQCPLLSLPLAFGTELESIPANVPYLSSSFDPPTWLRCQRPTDLQVGIVWAGGAINTIDRDRSLSLKALEPLWHVTGVSFYSLQRGSASLQAEASPRQFAGTLPQAGDFAATAAAVSNLDLVLSVDTAVAHLAGALGKPVWILLPVKSDWRWLTDRDDSPWYPSVTLFRQKVEGDWETVIARVATQLTATASKIMSLVRPEELPLE